MKDSAFSLVYVADLKGGRTVTVGAVRIQLSVSDTPCLGAIIQALRTNTGNVAVGGSDVSVSTGSENGIILVPGQSETLPAKNLTIIYIDAAVIGEGVSYTVMK